MSAGYEGLGPTDTWVITRKTLKAKIGLLVFFYAVPIIMSVIAFAAGWTY